MLRVRKLTLYCQVIDYGCGEAAVLSFLISATENNLNKIAGIDIDPEVLEEAVERCLPYKSDFEQLRPRPLVIDIYQGNMDVRQEVMSKRLNYTNRICGRC